MKTVAFSIPIYNIPKRMIKECLDSVLDIMKDTDQVEAYVMDNASTDKTIWPWLQENYSGHKDLHLVQFKENHGKPPTTKYTVDVADAKWLIILDSDDYIDKKEFMKILPDLEEQDADMIFTDYSYLNDQNGKIKRRHMAWTNKHMFEMKKMRRHMWHFDHNIIHNFDHMRRNGFKYPDNITAFEDIYNNMFVLQYASKILYIKTSFYMYRIKQEGKNMTSSEAMMRKNGEFTEMLYALADLDYDNPYTRNHMVYFFSLQMVSVMFWYDMKHKRWFPTQTRNMIKKHVKEVNPDLWKMLSAKNLYHWTFVGFIAIIATPVWRLAQVIVKKIRP